MSEQTLSPDIQFVGVSKCYGDVLAVDDVSLRVERGSFHSLLGPSGCGKTTSLRLIAGFEQPTSGDVRIRDESAVGVPAYRRPVNMVFQHYALFPHLTVGENVGYGLKQRKPRPPKPKIEASVDEILELVHLPGYTARRVWELSGGQQQRVALARALINRPTVLLLDEPLAALDRKLRRAMQMELQSLQREVGITFILVTHDQEEALSMSNHISIMRAGKVVQTATPGGLYDAPANRYVADFVGETNFFAGELIDADGHSATIRTDSGLVMSAPFSKNATPLNGARRAVVSVRPEMIRLERDAGAARESERSNVIKGQINNRIYLGDQTEFSVDTPACGELMVRVSRSSEAVSRGFAPGDQVVLSWDSDSGLALEDD